MHRLKSLRQRFDGRIALEGEHQKENAALAIAALRAANVPIDEDAIAHGLASVHWPARFQRWDDRIVIDGAHNPGGTRILAETWKRIFGEDRATVIFAGLQDKDIAAIVRALAPISARFFLPKIRAVRAVPPEELAAIVESETGRARRPVAPKTSVAVFDNFSDAVAAAHAHSERILITGSLHFAGEALAHLQGATASFEECLQ